MNIYYDVEDNHYRTYPDGDKANDNQIEEMVEGKKLSIIKLQQENQQLKDNWDKLKECLKDVMNSSDDDDKEFVETILDIIQELEGDNSNEI